MSVDYGGSEPGASHSGPGLRFSELEGALGRTVPWVIALAVLGALAAWGHAMLTETKIYEASAILVVVPPNFPSELAPPALSIQGYQELLESDAVVAETARRLAQQGILKNDVGLRLARQLDSTIFTSRRSEATLLAPMLRLKTRAGNGERAAALANTWAEVFLERSHALVVGTTSETVRFIEDQFPVARDNLVEVENLRLERETHFESRRTEALKKWQGRLSEARKTEASETANYETDSERLLSQFDVEHRLNARRVELSATRTLYSELQSEAARFAIRLEAKQLEVASLSEALAATPPTLPVKKVITDEALWQAVLTKGESSHSPATIAGQVLVSEEINPVHISLASRLATARAEVGALQPRASLLDDRIAALAVELDELEAGLANDQSEREALRRSREAGLQSIVEDQRSRMHGLEVERENELLTLSSESTNRLGWLDREIERQRNLFDELSDKFNEALLAKGKTDLDDVRLGAPAVPPQEPLKRGAGGNALAGFVLGGCVGLALVVARQSLRRRRDWADNGA